jgi:hypothetical protein
MAYELADITPEEAHNIQDDYGIENRGYGVTPESPPSERQYIVPGGNMGSCWAVDREVNSYLLKVSLPGLCDFHMYLFYFNNNPFVLKTTESVFRVEFMIGRRYPTLPAAEDKDALMQAFMVFGRFGSGKNGRNMKVGGVE